MAFQYKIRSLDGTLGEMKKFGVDETQEEKTERLVAINAQLAYESVMKDLRIVELNSNQADLTYQLMMKGVL
ncbi:hypothetical protein [Lysinibacillus sp. FSL K6-3209]|uniref:hypothetical protein n=1 Tax=Lysinibacillus sp. FSL K6-3209 TaxID=2921497 RepID=UPI0030DDC9B2